MMYHFSKDVLDRNPGLAIPPEKKSKYKNVPQVIGDMTFDSGQEAQDARKFILAVKAGEYLAYLHHVRIPVGPKIYYEADHVLITKELKVEVYDTKTTGTTTREFRLKAKLFKDKYGREIKLI